MSLSCTVWGMPVRSLHGIIFPGIIAGIISEYSGDFLSSFLLAPWWGFPWNKPSIARTSCLQMSLSTYSSRGSVDFSGGF